jgi:hypothetical protein
VEDIVRLVNHPETGWTDLAGGPIARGTILLALPRLVRDELVQVYVHGSSASELEELAVGRIPDVPLEECYFGLTARGRLVHANWAPAAGTS